MDTTRYSLKVHFQEIRGRLIKVGLFFVVSFIIILIQAERIYEILLMPLIKVDVYYGKREVIYTGLVEVFASYMKIASTGALFLSIPYGLFNIYKFIAPGLYPAEKRVALFIFIFSPVLLALGIFFSFYFVIPRAWQFFLSFENKELLIPIVFKAKVSEYLDLIIQIMLIFGLAFQMPVILLLLTALKIIQAKTLINARRIAIVVIFIIAAILTPPDILSQFALAIPMILLYEMSILLCKLVERQEHTAC